MDVKNITIRIPIDTWKKLRRLQEAGKVVSIQEAAIRGFDKIINDEEDSKMKQIGDPVVYSIPTDLSYYGNGATEKDVERITQIMEEKIQEYAEKNGYDLTIGFVPEKQSFGNKSTGDPHIIEEIDILVERNLWDNWA